MIYTIGGIKGGSGKTTVATNLAVHLASKGRDVLLIDADDQETATDFTYWRNRHEGELARYTSTQLANEAVRTETLKFAPKYDDIVIDTGGRDTASQRGALTVSDVCLIPFMPRSFDIWTMEKVSRLIREAKSINPKLYAVTFLNRTDSRGTDNDEAASLLRESDVMRFVEVYLCNRKAFANAAASGLGISELRPKDPKAEEEFLALVREIERIERTLGGQSDENREERLLQASL